MARSTLAGGRDAQALTILSDAVTSKSGGHAFESIERMRALLGYDYCGVGLITPTLDDGANVLMQHASSSFAKAFDAYKARRLDLIDPVAIEMARGGGVAFAQDVLANVSADKIEDARTMASFLANARFPAHVSLAINLPFESGSGFLAFGVRTDQDRDAFLAKIEMDLPYLRLAGMAYADSALRNRTTSPVRLLPPAELGVLKELADGWKLAEIAQRHRKSFSTIRRQADGARNRLGAKTTAQAVRIACKIGLL